MSATHASGAIQGTRLGCDVIAHSMRYNQANSLASGTVNTKMLVVPATPAKPIAIRLRAVVTEAFNDVGAVTLSSGSSSGSIGFLAAVDLKAAAGTSYVPTATPAGQIYVVETETPVWVGITHAGAAGTLGKVDIIVELFEINIVLPTAQGD